MPSELLSTSENRVTVLALSSTDGRNLLTPAVCAAGIEALNIAADSDEASAVVITGVGHHFSWGEDLEALYASSRFHVPADTESLNGCVAGWSHWIEAIATFPKPIVAAVEGNAAGAGATLALSCDLMVAADDATFSMPHGASGPLPAAGAIWQAVRSLPSQLAAELLLGGCPLNAPRLHAVGAVNRLVPPSGARGEAVAWASRWSHLPMPVVFDIKELMRAARDLPLNAHLVRERDRHLHHLHRVDAREALKDALTASHPPFPIATPWIPHS